MKPVFLGAYRLIAKLGRGRVTDVYLATRGASASKDDLVVVKRLRTSRTSPDDTLPEEAQVPLDADLAPLLHHPNIVTTLEFDQSGSAPYWVTEYVDGQPLDRVITASSRAGGLPIGFGLRILCDLLSALDYAHGLSDDSGQPLGIVHRDVRPHNIFVNYYGEVKLADFGMPRPAVHGDPAASSSDSGRAYVAPEQAMMGSVDLRADIFAVGLMMWELLARQRRSGAEGFVGTLQGLQPELAADQAGMPTEISTELHRINDRAIERDPESRYATAAEMRDELEAALERLEDVRCATPGMARANLGSLVQRLFKSERSDTARRIQLLLAVDGISQPGAAANDAASSGTNGVRQPALRLSQASELTQGTASDTQTPVGMKRPSELAQDTAGGARTPVGMQLPEELDTRIPEEVAPSSRRSEVPPPPPLPKRLSLSSPDFSPGVQPRSASKRTEREGKGAAAIAAALLVLGAVGVTWAMTSSTPNHQESQTSAALSSKSDATTEPVLRLCGSNTIGAELAPALVEALFASKDSAAKTAHKREIDSDVTHLISKSDDKTLTAEITARGTATGFAGLAEGNCDVAMASRVIEEAETKRLEERGLGDLSSAANEHVVALDGVAVIVHPNNPIAALNRQDLHEIFTGKVTNWADVGGKQGPIHVLARDDQSGTYDTFKHLVLGDDKLISGARRYVLSDALSDAVASDPGAIGFVGLAYVRTAKALAVGEPGASPLLPTQFTVATEGYMLSRRLYLYTPDKPRTPWVTELVNFAMSPRGQQIAGKAGFVNLSLLTDSTRCRGECPPRYLSTIANAHRVSVDLRFLSGSNQPDSRARRDMDRLVTFLQHFREPKVLLLGFSDSIGHASANQKLSVERAKTIAEELALRGIEPSVVTGFGSEMPVASNDTEAGRQRNRRVEVWFEHL